MEDDVFYGDLEMKVSVHNGDVYINDEFISQLCWTPDMIGYAVADYVRDSK